MYTKYYQNRIFLDVINTFVPEEVKQVRVGRDSVQVIQSDLNLLYFANLY